MTCLNVLQLKLINAVVGSCIRHMRIRVKDILDMLASGMTRDEILDDCEMIAKASE